MPSEKPGIKTTEFWMTLLAQIMPILIIVGAIPEAEADTVSKSIAAVVAGIISLVSLVAYIWGRTEVKKAEVEMKGEVKQEELKQETIQDTKGQ